MRNRGVAFLPLAKRCRLVIVGGGHIGQAVAALAADLDFEVWVTDDRESYVSEARFPSATNRIAGPCKEVLPSIDITPDTYCLVVTRGHNHDQEALYHLVERGARYVGMIGSKRKIRLIFDDLAAEGISADSLGAVFAPVGIDIGSQTCFRNRGQYCGGTHCPSQLCLGKFRGVLKVRSPNDRILWPSLCDSAGGG